MSADNRSTHTDALATLGTIIDINKEKRDAIHLGVEPAVCGFRMLNAGDHIGFDNKDEAVSGHQGIKHVGIVDPFLTKPVQPGEAFWLIVYPRQITSLRHVWEHPDFKDSQETTHEVNAAKFFDPETHTAVAASVDPGKLHKVKLLLNEPQALAKQRLIDFAYRLDIDYQELMDHAEEHVLDGSYWVHEEDGGKFEGESIYDGFWEDYKLVTEDEKVEPNNLYNFFSCSCQ